MYDTIRAYCLGELASVDRIKDKLQNSKLCIYDKTNWAKEKDFDVPTPSKGLEWVRAFGTGVKTEYKEDVDSPADYILFDYFH